MKRRGGPIAAPRVPAAGPAAFLAAVALAAAGGPASSAASAPRPRAATATVPARGAPEAILLEADTGQILFARAPDREVAVASTTKLMTALVTLEHIHRLGTVFRQFDYVAPPVDSQIALRPGEPMSVHDLLVALMLPSADDAAEDLAHNVGGGSTLRFIAMMNRRARELGLSHTHYSTPSGLDTPGNHSSARDLARLARVLLHSSPFMARVVAEPSAVLRTGYHVRFVRNRNDLVGRVPWIDGIKTGHTSQAGYVLVADAHRDGLHLTSVVLGTAGEGARDAATLSLLSWGFAGYHRVQAVRRGQLIARLSVKDQPGRRARVLAAAGWSGVLSRRDRLLLTPQLPRQVAGPQARGARVGTLLVSAGGRRLAAIPLVLARAVPAVGRLTIMLRFLLRPITLGVLIALIAALAVLATRWGRGRGSPAPRPRPHDPHRHPQRSARQDA